MMLILHNAFVYMFSFFFFFYDRYYTSKVLGSYDVLIVFIPCAAALCGQLYYIPSKHFHTHEHFLPSHLFESVLRSVLFIRVHKGDGIFPPVFFILLFKKKYLGSSRENKRHNHIRINANIAKVKCFYIYIQLVTHCIVSNRLKGTLPVERAQSTTAEA